jgi:hypothetical protein
MEPHPLQTTYHGVRRIRRMRPVSSAIAARAAAEPHASAASGLGLADPVPADPTATVSRGRTAALAAHVC